MFCHGLAQSITARLAVRCHSCAELLLHRPVTARRAAAGGPVDVQHVVQLQPNNTMADAERWASELESTIVTDATL